MYIHSSQTIVIYIQLLLLYITSTVTLLQTNNNTASRSSEISSNVLSNIPTEGGRIPVPTNVTIIPGPNLNPVISDLEQNSSKNAAHSSYNKHPVTVLSEGGDNSIFQSVNRSNVTNITTTISHNSDVASHAATLSGNAKVININPQFPIESGGKPVLKKDPALNVNANSLLPKVEAPKNSDAVSITSLDTIPVSEPVENNYSRQKIAPRKGVNNLEYNEFKKSESNSSTKPVVKKPLLTEAAEDESSSKLNLDVSSGSNTTHVELKPKVPSLDRFNEFSNNTQQYVIPIVIVILSVPLVTIIISFLLKRGAEWWKYRHYRRMDFLINGIYDT